MSCCPGTGQGDCRTVDGIPRKGRMKAGMSSGSGGGRINRLLTTGTSRAPRNWEIGTESLRDCGIFGMCFINQAVSSVRMVNSEPLFSISLLSRVFSPN